MSNTSHSWIELPANADFTERESWQRLPSGHYAASRATVLVVRRDATSNDDNGPRHGPPERSYTVPANTTYTIQLQNERVIYQQQTLEHAISQSVTAKVCEEWTTKISSALAAKAAGLTAAVSAELQTKTVSEVSDSISSGLRQSNSYSIEETDSLQRTIAISPLPIDRTITLRRVFWPTFWDVYLYSVEFMQLRYQRDWPWSHIRETIATTSSGRLGWPLFRLTTYRPQPGGLDLSPEVVSNELSSPTSIQVSMAPALHVFLDNPPATVPLLETAREAFPASIPERLSAHKKRQEVKKAAAKKVAPKRPAAKKAAATRPAAKKAAKRAAAKKSAGKRAARP